MKSMEGKAKRQGSVKSWIFYSNAVMILVTIAVCALIGKACVKVYWEKEEIALQGMLGGRMAAAEAEALIRSVTVHNDLFILMAVIFAIACAAALILVSHLFTKSLTKKIMYPLELLEQGAGRIRAGDYSTAIAYTGDAEFEQVCAAFDSMQRHLQEEKEKNARYEKARQEMIAGISHDIRSPLTAIRGSVKALLDGVVDAPERQKFLQAAYRRSGEIDALLRELFYFSKLETGGIPVQVQQLDLSEYLRNYCHAKKELPDYADVEFVCDIPETRGNPASADPEALQRILDNILSNSRKYAEVKPLRLFVSLQREDGYQRIVLQDNGRGVPKDKVGRLFEEFYRVDESRGRKEGSGLGLYIVKYLCEAMGGRVSADMESHQEGFAGLAVSLLLKEGGKADGGEGEDPDR